MRLKLQSSDSSSGGTVSTEHASFRWTHCSAKTSTSGIGIQPTFPDVRSIGMDFQATGVPSKPCPPEKRQFFDWLDKTVTQMAKDLKTSRELMFTIAAKEGGWTQENLNHNVPLNNPFGVKYINKKGQAAGNHKYANVQDAADDWKSQFGDRVNGAKTKDDAIKGVTTS
jgi:hypothetical protein